MNRICCTAIIFLSFLFSSCENITNVDSAVPYKEYTVVNAELSAYKIFKGVRITHTMPLGVQYDIQKTEIKNALAYLLEDGTRVITLHYTSEGLYYPVEDLYPEPGNHFELFIKLEGKSIYGKTYIPESPGIVVTSNAGNNYLTAIVNAEPGEAYAAVWRVAIGNGQPDEIASDFYSVESADHFPSTLLVRTMDISPPFNSTEYSVKYFIQVYAFDKDYKDYFISKKNSDKITNTFTSGGGPVSWNVYGENVIGIFIGVTEGNAIRL